MFDFLGCDEAPFLETHSVWHYSALVLCYSWGLYRCSVVLPELMQVKQLT